MAVDDTYPMADGSTIEYYDHNSYMFITGTQNLSMGETLDAFLDMIPDGGRVLDWGCGSGRDSLAMAQRGYRVTSTDASQAMCESARRLIGADADVRHEAFSELSDSGYDGIWACASLIHVKPNELGRILAIARGALKPDGVLYCSFKLGEGCGYRHGRWFTNMNETTLGKLLTDMGFAVERLWVTSDVRRDRSDDRWVNALARVPKVAQLA